MAALAAPALRGAGAGTMGDSLVDLRTLLRRMGVCSIS